VVVAAYFIVSIDTELKWAYRFHPDKKVARMLQNHEDTAIAAIDSILQLLETYKVPATWAIVGKLFYEHPEIVDKIRGMTIEHEIGYHSFSHIRFSESSRQAAKIELDEGLKIQDEFGVDFKSFVFPENEIGHVDLLRQYGYTIYRGPNNAGKSVGASLLVRALNFAPSKIVAPPVEPIWKDVIWEIQSSMMLFDLPYFQKTLSLRAKKGIEKAIAVGNTFHLSIHPEDVLREPKMLDRFEKVLQFVNAETEEDQLSSITMGDFASALR
jgi:peptidoglycan/xylan/chitin deacetylase (PgdA/CDA1 family)